MSEVPKSSPEGGRRKSIAVSLGNMVLKSIEEVFSFLGLGDRKS